MNRIDILKALVLGLVAAGQAVQAQEVKPTRVETQLAEKGFKKCGPSIGKAVRWVHGDDSKYRFITTWGTKNPDNSIALVTTTYAYTDSTMLTTFTASPDASGGCTVTSSQILPFATSCTALRETTFKDWKFIFDMGATAAYERDQEKSLTSYLTPTPGGGCMVLKQVVFFY